MHPSGDREESKAGDSANAVSAACACLLISRAALSCAEDNLRGPKTLTPQKHTPQDPRPGTQVAAPFRVLATMQSGSQRPVGLNNPLPSILRQTAQKNRQLHFGKILAIAGGCQGNNLAALNSKAAGS